VRAFVRENSLGLFFLVLFLVVVGAQSVAGWLDYNEDARAHEAAEYTYGRYVLSSHFGQAVLENWQSEYLQFLVFIVATIWLVQRGSAESKPVEDAGPESDRRQLVGRYALRVSPQAAKAGGWRTWLYGNSLLLVIGALFLGSWLGQSVTGMTEYNEAQLEHGSAPVSWLGYLQRPDFWEATLQNWQSEFLAVGTMVVFTVYLRQRGSPESKPVGAPHRKTEASG
jgi:Domain of unknown function (DUF6766)